jgi:hypothetical protein
MLGACSYRTEAPVVKQAEAKEIVKEVVVKKEIVAPSVNVETENTSSYYVSEPTITGKIVGDYGNGGLIRTKIKGIVKDYELLLDDVSRIERDIKRTSMKISSATSDYVSLVAGMIVRLQTGTTPGNPRLVSQWNQAQIELEDLSKELITLTSLANDVDNNSSLASFLINAIRATYGISGAVEEEHEELKRIEDELTQLVNRISRVVTTVNDDISRQTSYLSEERRNMQNLSLAVKRGEFFGNSVMNRTMQSWDDFEARQSAYEMKRTAISSRYPIITIRFAEDNVDYTKMLYKAVDGAIDLKANAHFNVVSVSPEASSMMTTEASKEYAKSKAEQVFRDMVKMGVPAKNINIVHNVSADVDVTEVQIFLK